MVRVEGFVVAKRYKLGMEFYFGNISSLDTQELYNSILTYTVCVCVCAAMHVCMHVYVCDSVLTYPKFCAPLGTPAISSGKERGTHII